MQKAYTSLRVFALALVGCVLGVIGITIYTEQSPLGVFQDSSVIHVPGNNLANACLAEDDRKEDIYFVSCGGFF